ncbi:MAG: hypothetical protein GF331_13915, partial [Chitinivibrionales bacterium]|nr:hypothetical protein [Chitinivibrionales bacterium]
MQKADQGSDATVGLTRRHLLGWTFVLIATTCSGQTVESAVVVGLNAPLGATVGWEGFTSNRGFVGMHTRAQIEVLPPFDSMLMDLLIAGGVRGYVPLSNAFSLRLHAALTGNAYGFFGSGFGVAMGVGATTGMGCAWERTDLTLS